MTRDEFLKFIEEHSPRWLPEESTTGDFIDIICVRLTEHRKELKEIDNE